MSIDTSWYEAYDTSGSVTIFYIRLKAEVKREKKNCALKSSVPHSRTCGDRAPRRKKIAARFSDSYAKGCNEYQSSPPGKWAAFSGRQVEDAITCLRDSMSRHGRRRSYLRVVWSSRSSDVQKRKWIPKENDVLSAKSQPEMKYTVQRVKWQNTQHYRPYCATEGERV